MDFAQGPDKIQEKNEAFARLVDEYQTSLLRACFLYLKDRELARDAAQEAFLRAYRGWDAFRGDSSEKTWLIKIAVNVCHDLNRSGWRRFTDRRVTPETLPPARLPFFPEEEHLILDVMRLPPRLREAVILRYYHQMTVGEISSALGIAHSSVSGRLKRAEKKLKDTWEGGKPL